jgi:hypothetical protein
LPPEVRVAQAQQVLVRPVEIQVLARYAFHMAAVVEAVLILTVLLAAVAVVS